VRGLGRQQLKRLDQHRKTRFASGVHL
jgi:hypothetical protein